MVVPDVGGIASQRVSSTDVAASRGISSLKTDLGMGSK